MNLDFLRRRGFLAVLGAGAMTLGVTVLGWIPLARPARAEPGTEYPDCGRYSDRYPDGSICVGAPYSPAYCGEDKWFITGCYDRPEGRVCFDPAPICRASRETNAGRNAWRWVAGDVTYRCADGYARYEGAPDPEVVICSARLSQQPPPPRPTTSAPPPPPPTTTSTPPPTSTPTRPPALPRTAERTVLSELPLFPSLIR